MKKPAASVSGRLLVVDDEIELMSVICEALQGQGYEAAGFSSAGKALEALQQESYDLLLTDLMMPEMDGIALLHAALKIQPQLVGIVMTGQGTIQTAVEAMKTGAYDYVLKPFRLNALLPVLARAMELQRLRQENVELRSTLAVHELSKTVAHTLNPDALLNSVADAVLQQFEADEMSIMLTAGSTDEMEIAVVRGEDRASLQGRRVARRDGIAGWVARHREPLIMHGAVDDPRYGRLEPRSGIHSSMSMPMLAGGKLVGVLNLNVRRKGAGDRLPFQTGELKALSILANATAAALESARLYQQVVNTNRALEQALSELKSAQEQLVFQERLRALGEMASGVAHDFNNALSAILGVSETMLMFPEEMQDRQKVADGLEMIHTVANDAASLVARLRDFYRSRDQGEEPVGVDLNALMLQVIALTKPRWKPRGRRGSIQVLTEPGVLPLVPAIDSDLRQALTNLIFNAVDAMPDGGIITLRSLFEGDEAIVEVADNGNGMTEDVRVHCLEPFFTTKGEQGTGLGLAMVYGVVRRHQGSIDIQSAPNRGTTVRIRLPLIAPAAALPAEA